MIETGQQPGRAGREPGWVLITRPMPAAEATARRVADLGMRPLLAPMLSVSSRSSSLPEADRIAAVLVTSAAAVPLLPARLHGTPLFAVGDATASSARHEGFLRVESASGNADTLADLVHTRCDPHARPLLLATSSGQGMPLVRNLRTRGYRVIRRTIYSTRTVTHLSDDAITALRNSEIRSVLVFSRETGHALVRSMRRAGVANAAGGIDAFAISAAAAEALAPLPWRRIRVASAPNQDELLALLT